MANLTSSPESLSPKRQSNSSFFITISAILAMLSRQARRLKGKAKTKKLLSNMSNKALSQFGKMKKTKKQRDNELNDGVWQKEILMGGKCEPLDFSGVIHYDINGRQTGEVPLRSPRAIPFSRY
ncbi:hypothetical protein MtrunA17_Chr4g0039681 [Medicago truncatula]|uniref:Transmembrane protein n=1 Tax=Medicago truncatula TaxID=3880 RepID=A0A072UMP2_MEDTR|nr:uncharacterized protein LOC25492892 [Medicago truncatula]KEH30656.1 hypothetical protein MTR_4g077777 [Medicago truncatula]RHN61719.1 hypothetical protein MtrunA17_Chr4g0039681 [Medicago truncatula]